jgi:hypothetical protein
MKPVMTSPSLSSSTIGDLVEIDLRHVLRGHARAFIVKVRQLRGRREIVGDRHGELRAVLRRDFPDRVFAQIHARLWVGARNEVFRPHFSQSLRDDALRWRIRFRQRELRRRRRLLPLRGPDYKQRCRRHNREPRARTQ